MLYFQFNVGSIEDGFLVKERPSICFGGITDGFVHATRTEIYLIGKRLTDPATLKGALNTLSQELNPHKAILEAEPKYRKNLAQSLLYKTILSIIYETLDEKMTKIHKKKYHNIDFFSNENTNKCLLFTEVMKIVQPLVHIWQHFFLFWSTV